MRLKYDLSIHLFQIIPPPTPHELLKQWISNWRSSGTCAVVALQLTPQNVKKWCNISLESFLIDFIRRPHYHYHRHQHPTVVYFCSLTHFTLLTASLTNRHFSFSVPFQNWSTTFLTSPSYLRYDFKPEVGRE